MQTRTLRIVFLTLGLSLLGRTDVPAQGGWDVWTIQLRDGSSIEAAPVWSLDADELRYGFGDSGETSGRSVARASIGSLSNGLGNSEYRASKGADYVLPPMPEADPDQDLVVLDDGRQVPGAVLIRPRTDESGQPQIYEPVLVQNGVETDLTRVAHIKLAATARGAGREGPR